MIWRGISLLLRCLLVLANASVFCAGCWFLWVILQLTLDYPTQLAGTQYPPLHSFEWYQAVSLIVFKGYFAIAFPYLIGMVYSLAAVLTLCGVRDLLHTAPPRWLHSLVVLMCLAPAALWLTESPELSKSMLVVACGVLPALASVLPSLRPHALSIVGLAAAVTWAYLLLARDPIWQLALIPTVLILTALFAWVDREVSRVEREMPKEMV